MNEYGPVNSLTFVLAELALECCSRGCSEKIVEQFCCSQSSRTYGHPKVDKKTEEEDEEVIMI